MRITWKDGVTTLATAGAVALQQAHANGWNWPLMSSTSWAITGVFLLSTVAFIFGFMLDEVKGPTWAAVATSLAVIIVGLTVFGLIDPINDYLTALVWSTIIFWISSIGWHLTEPSGLQPRHV